MSEFFLFVAGDSPLARRAVTNFDEAIRPVAGECNLEVVDIIRDPQKAAEYRILATPTLLRRTPPPPLRVVGDFSDQSVIGGLFANGQS